MPIEKAQPFNMKDLTLDVRLDTIVEGNTRDFTGRKIFSVDFFRKSIGFGITDIDIEVNTSLQPIITITFKDLYGNTVFGKNQNSNPDLANDDGNPDFSALFNWPPPKFLFTFKGFLGKSASWMLNMKKSSVSYESSDGSYSIKCEFVPNQWGFLADLPFLYLLAVKSLKKKSGLKDDELKKVQTIFDLIKIGKQVEVKTKETTKEFDNIMKQMTLIKSLRVYDAIGISKVVNYDEAITGQVGNQIISPFNLVKIIAPKGTDNADIDTVEKIKSLANNAQTLGKVNSFLLLTAQVGTIAPYKIDWKTFSAGDTNTVIPNFEEEKNSRLKLISQNIENIENAIKKKTFDSSKAQLEKITIGEIFRQLAEDAGYIMGRILEAGYRGYEDNAPIRNSLRKQLIGRNFPLCITSEEKEEKAATLDNLGADVGVDSGEMQFVSDFIDAISEGIATELATDEDAAAATGDNLIKKRINNAEGLRGNPYQPFYQNIAENILVRGGIAAYLTRSPDPNRPGDYDTTFDTDRATEAEDIFPLADADLENITDTILGGLSDDDFKSLKRFCIFWDNLLTEDANNLRKPDSNGVLVEGDSLFSGGYLSAMKGPIRPSLNDYQVVIEKPANWTGDFTADGVQFTTLGNIISEIFRPKPVGGSTGSTDSTNANFIGANFQAVKLVNNGIAYFKAPESIGSDVYTYIMFDGPDANKTQEIASADTDGEVKNVKEEQKDSDEPVGYVNIQTPTDKDGELLPVVEEMNSRITKRLLLNYPRMINPSGAFFSNPNSLTAGPVPPLNEGNIGDYFLVSTPLGDPDNLPVGSIPAKNIAVSIAFHSDEESDDLIFGPFVIGLTGGLTDSLVHRGWIKRMCSKLKEKLDGIEQKKNQIISDVLGKAGEQKDGLYKQMHVLYQQWEVLIIKDSDSAQSCTSNGHDTKPFTKGEVASEMADRYKGKEKHINTNIPENIASEAADNTFIYAYPLNFFPSSKKINVKNSVINIEPLYKPNGNTTILNAIQQICTKNNFIFIPMPGEPGALSVKEVFSPHPVQEPKIKNFFYVQFAPTPESRATLSNSENGTPLSSAENIKDIPDLYALEIKFGSPENQIVKNFTVDTQESKATAESIINLQRLVDNENQNKTVTTDCSMLPVMEGRSYKATADMLGNAQIFPMQFFFLDSIPLFNGLYQIMKVKHSIKPNDMTTSAEGIRMRTDFQTGKCGGIPPVTLETLADLPVSLKPVDSNLDYTSEETLNRHNDDVDNTTAAVNLTLAATPTAGTPISAGPQDSGGGTLLDSIHGYASPDWATKINNKLTKPATATSLKSLPIPNFRVPMEHGGIYSLFGPRGIVKGHSMHPGIDLSNGMGTPILAAAAGTVIRVTKNFVDGGGYGNSVIIKHSDRFYTLYGHLKVANVTLGQIVQSGQKIGEEGNTEDGLIGPKLKSGAMGAHLHFEIRDLAVSSEGFAKWGAVNPQFYILKGVAKGSKF
jgi:murein DD-endopeptidase MepM/ murein hydrolase activator NlpD